MNNVVNLNRFRKMKERVEDARRADENRQKSGETKAAQKTRKAKDEKARNDLDGHKREDDDDA